MEATNNQTSTCKQTCFCTLITSDSFVVGAQALILSILDKCSFPSNQEKRDILVLHTTDVSRFSLKILQKIKGIKFKLVDKLVGQVDPNRKVESWSDFTKLHIWSLVEYERVVYLDADMLVMEDIGDLFTRDLGTLGFAAAPDVFPPDKFNAGLLVLTPDIARFNQIILSLHTLPSYDGGDTGLLNAIFPGWFQSSASNRLPFCYNAQRTLHWLTYQAQPGYWNAIGPKKVIHFSSSPKPWLDTKKQGELELLWWSRYNELVVAASTGQLKLADLT
jgi:glycogenin glucosyltransferase